MPELTLPINDGLNQCQGCNQPIKDQYIFKVLPDMQWHEHCLQCAECNCQLTDTCFVRGNKAYCRTDYSKLFYQKSCNKCGIALKPNDLIMKSKEKTFHLECFKCQVCFRKLNPGEEYSHIPETDMLYCRDDTPVSPKFLANTNMYYNRFQSSTMSITPENSSSSSSCSYSPSTASSSSCSSVMDSPSNFNNMNSSFQSNQTFSQLIEPSRNQYEFDSYQNKEDNSESEDDDNLIDDDNDESLTDDESSFTEQKLKSSKKLHKGFKSKINNKQNYSSSPDSLLMQLNQNYSSSGSHSSKPARIRTVLNEKQLHTLRVCYGANPRPDALMKEQLVEMTGLNPRVIRVWFQNKRCKDKKKNMLRPDHTQGNNPMNHHLQNLQFNSNNNQHLMFDHCF